MKSIKQKAIFLLFLFVTAIVPTLAFADVNINIGDKKISPAMVSSKLVEKAQKNDNWKLAFVTGRHGQVVFMNITPQTNPKNEIGVETHSFDQVILVVEGDGKAILNGKTSMVNTGDMIFIPQGVEHNVINLNQGKALKIISFYSDTDIPANSVYPKKSDES